ncbi:DegV family protein [Cardiobacteriaceae bacterium TAE3-ERU3]|nr:DegV family protein [Cardiobacteriaceae bacterium TAE3-ERU3]
MNKHIIITTSSAGLNYCEYEHDVHVIFGTVSINGQRLNKVATDVEEICPMQLRAEIEKHPDAKVHFTPPTAQMIYTDLLELLEQNYEEYFIVASEHKSSKDNFNQALELLTPEQRAKFNFYSSETLGFGCGLLALKADELFKQGKTSSYVINKLKEIEQNSILLCTTFELDSVPDNIFTSEFKKSFFPSLSGRHPLVKVPSLRTPEKIASFNSYEALLDGFVDQIKKYIGNCPYNGYVICPVNHPASRWFAETMEEKLGGEHISVLPITPVVASLFGIDFLAVRVYALPECLSQLYRAEQRSLAEAV